MSDEAFKRDDFIICAYAVGISCARANGSLPVYKVEALSDLVFGIGNVQSRSQYVQDKVREMTLNPPNVFAHAPFGEDGSVWREPRNSIAPD